MDQKVLNKHSSCQLRCSLKKICFVLTSLSDLSQESWASDLSRVREFLMGYMRGGPQSEPMLQLDEVTTHKDTNVQENYIFLASCLITWFYFLVPDLPVLQREFYMRPPTFTCCSWWHEKTYVSVLDLLFTQHVSLIIDHRFSSVSLEAGQQKIST